jgi:hypothetical protein
MALAAHSENLDRVIHKLSKGHEDARLSRIVVSLES